MGLLVTDLLDPSRIEAGRVELWLSEVSPTDLLSKVLEGLGAVAQERGSRWPSPPISPSRGCGPNVTRRSRF